MNKLKSLFIVTMLLTALSISVSAQKYTEIKIKTSAQSEMCKDRIENAIAYEKGVKDCSLDLKSKVLTVKYETKKNDAAKIKTAITKLGYDADKMKADKVAYSKLPKECKKSVKSSNNPKGCGSAKGCGGHKKGCGSEN